MELYAIQESFLEKYLEAIENATLEDKNAAFERFGDVESSSIIGRTEGSSVATISIIGVLTPDGPSPIARFFGFGGTGYSEIIAAIDELEKDQSITDVTIVTKTPGGTIEGMDLARQAIERLAVVKNVTFENHGLIASAGYYLATAEGVKEIVAMSPLDETGSIGIARGGFDYTDALAREGVKRIKIISSNAPNKQADPNTTQGRQVHQDELDAVERVFISKIAIGRNTTEQNVIENFGQGGVFIAQDPDPDKPDALKAGMIDRVIAQTNSGGSNAIGGVDEDPEMQAVEGGGQTKGTIKMDLTKLKSEHPSLYAEVVSVGVAQGIDTGATQERERVDAHLTLGEASGDMKYATLCIKEGTGLTAVVTAKHMAASMNKNAKGDRATESEGDLSTEGGEGDSSDKDLAEATAKLLGVETNA